MPMQNALLCRQACLAGARRFCARYRDQGNGERRLIDVTADADCQRLSSAGHEPYAENSTPDFLPGVTDLDGGGLVLKPAAHLDGHGACAISD